jgi:hypothetical protein
MAPSKYIDRAIMIAGTISAKAARSLARLENRLIRYPIDADKQQKQIATTVSSSGSTIAPAAKVAIG